MFSYYYQYMYASVDSYLIRNIVTPQLYIYTTTTNKQTNQNILTVYLLCILPCFFMFVKEPPYMFDII